MIPDRKPDVHQILTEDELTLAAVEWLRDRKRIQADGNWYQVQRISDVAAGTHQIKLWKEP